MDDTLPDNLTPDVEDTLDISAELRAKRDSARAFLSNWRDSSESLGQSLIAQLEATANELSAMVQSEGDDQTDFEDRRRELSQEAEKLSQLRDELAQRESRLAELQESFTTQNQRLLESLEEQNAHLKQQREELSSRQEQLQQQSGAALQAQENIDQRLNGLQAMLTDLDERQSQLNQARGEVEADQRTNEAARAELQRQREEFEQLQAKVETASSLLSSREQQLEEREQRAREARTQLARELKVRKREQLAEIDRRRLELEEVRASEDAAIEEKLAEFQEELSRLQQETDLRSRQAEDLRGQLDAAQSKLQQRDAQNLELTERLEEIASADRRNSGEVAELTAQLAEAQEKANSQRAAAQAALASAREDRDELRGELDQAKGAIRQSEEQVAQRDQQIAKLHGQIEAAGDEASQQRIRELESERDALLERLSDAEELSSGSAPKSQQLEELQARFEMAIKDVRELKFRNSQLEEKLAAGGGADLAAAGPLDWEAQKKAMLAKLEADCDEDDEQKVADRLTVEGAIGITDQVVADKQAEIDELRKLLDEQSQNLGGVAVGAAAIAEMLDSDELVKLEREKLEAMQEEWREKLRKAEIDISVERAKIARERAQLEEQLQSAQHATISGGGGGSDSADGKPKRGKWLARLGLGEDEK